MKDSVTARILALPNCSYRELGEQWRAVWGTDPPRKSSREFLIRAVAYGIQVQAFGGLDAKTLQLLRKANDTNAATEAAREAGSAKDRSSSGNGMARRTRCSCSTRASPGAAKLTQA